MGLRMTHLTCEQLGGLSAQALISGRKQRLRSPPCSLQQMPERIASALLRRVLLPENPWIIEPESEKRS